MKVLETQSLLRPMFVSLLDSNDLELDSRLIKKIFGFLHNREIHDMFSRIICCHSFENTVLKDCT